MTLRHDVMNPDWKELASRASVSLSNLQIDAMHRYLDLLLDGNTRMNLTRIVERGQAELLHVADTLTLLPFLPRGPCRVADLGSGGGVPGLPLAIVRPEASFLLVESTKKKAAFIRETVQALELKNVMVDDRRVEEVGRTGYRNSFDVVTARAVALLPWLVEWALPLLKPTGRLLAMKGTKVAEEIALAVRAVRFLRASEPVVHPVELPGTQDHVIVELTKKGLTPAAYPRDSSATRGKHL